MSSILIIEDDLDLAELMAITLRTAGHDTRHAPDGRSALDALALKRPDIVLLDVMLPDIVGFSLCESLRAISATVDLPILVVSACDEYEGGPLARASGADGYLPKPFSPRQLLARTKAVLTRRRSRAA
jgi:two-component system phosphate regulon response regulator PhoB